VQRQQRLYWRRECSEGQWSDDANLQLRVFREVASKEEEDANYGKKNQKKNSLFQKKNQNKNFIRPRTQ
jgi:hypothetical protein